MPPVTKERVRLYFPHKTDPVLIVEDREVQRVGTQPEWVALTELLAGPQSQQARQVIAPELRPHFIAPKVLESELILFIDPEAGAALQKGGMLPIYAMVNTRAQGQRVTQVRFALNRTGGSLVVDGVDITQPVKPRWDLVKPRSQ